MSPTECRLPHLAPKTAYGKGCRCERCVATERARLRRRHAQNREAELERNRIYHETHQKQVKARRAKRYEANRDRLLEEWRQYRRDHPEKEQARGRRRRGQYAALEVLVSGRYTPEEDEIVTWWTETDLELAKQLRRSYPSVVRRKRRLREAADRVTPDTGTGRIDDSEHPSHTKRRHRTQAHLPQVEVHPTQQQDDAIPHAKPTNE